jgi:Asp-tRNA(Asn)/Glu-tRNA(Gln) amidotransferase A subunit family amidase
MGYMNLSIDEIKDALKSNKTTPIELTKEALELGKKYQDKYNLFVTITENEALERANNLNGDINSPLFGIPY